MPLALLGPEQFGEHQMNLSVEQDMETGLQMGVSTSPNVADASSEGQEEEVDEQGCLSLNPEAQPQVSDDVLEEDMLNDLAQELFENENIECAFDQHNEFFTTQSSQPLHEHVPETVMCLNGSVQ